MRVYEVIGNGAVPAHWFNTGTLVIEVVDARAPGRNRYAAVPCVADSWRPGGGWETEDHSDPDVCLRSHNQEVHPGCLKPIDLPTLPLHSVERFLSDAQYTLSTALQNHITPTDSKGEPA